MTATGQAPHVIPSTARTTVEVAARPNPGKFDGMTMGPFAVAWDPDDAHYGPYVPDQPRNRGHVSDPKLTAMIKEQRRVKDVDARKKLVFEIQRYMAEQQHYVSA